MPRRTLETLVALVVIAILFYFLMVRVILVKEEQRPVPQRDFGATAVSTRQVEVGIEWPEIQLSGSLAPRRRLALSAETGGRVVEVLEGWRAGRKVAAGELLFAIDPAPLELALASAEARLAEARAASGAAAVEVQAAGDALPILAQAVEVAGRERARLAGLVDSGESSASMVDAALAGQVQAQLVQQAGASALARATAALAARKAGVQTAEAAVAQAQEAIRHLELRAPFAGSLTADGPELGTLLTPGGSLIPSAALGELVDLGGLRLLAQAHETQLARIELGAKARVELPSIPGLELDAEVVRLAPLADPLTRNLTVELRVTQPARPLPAGLFARARIRASGAAGGGLWLARGEFIWDSAGVPIAFTVEARDNTSLAVPHALELGPAVGEGFLVLSGLEVGAELITGPLDRLSFDHATAVAPREL
jgi:multidrug resistance efflux pump